MACTFEESPFSADLASLVAIEKIQGKRNIEGATDLNNDDEEH